MHRAFWMILLWIAMALPAAALPPTDKFFDPVSKQWVRYRISPEAAGAIAREKYKRQTIYYRSHEAPGTVIIDTDDRYLYYILGNNRAVRYGIGVGREGFEWSGVEKISRKKKWPSWTPPPEMIQRQPDLPRFMPGGPKNPLGARALYIGSTLYRIHGTNEDWSIGRAVSSGCIRMLNDDVINLYNRVDIGAKVIVK
ncbi:L,D-transpeptidase [Rhodobium gokarnense]|uniref:Lipoprotein-anchoring transpeptidase ErfK/SrfK n=1 Tax=Rhodobium gokarnense TaxID=364296 RepID=A0ABT3HHH6_9HYPH|nr:L,D-transpeptidase [Rhodobium gokarnense]MCW2309865.1 lipoprotein-anchoring transpeptidase ErfK/SrfK [Rhodobium gokarnense]